MKLFVFDLGWPGALIVAEETEDAARAIAKLHPRITDFDFSWLQDVLDHPTVFDITKGLIIQTDGE